MLLFWVSSGLGGALPVLSDDYGSTKSLPTVTHQTLPAFSQPFGSRANFRNYSPPYSSQQTATGGTGTAGNDAGSWSYSSPNSGALTSQYETVAAPTRRQASNSTAQHQLSAAASLSASEYSQKFLFFFFMLTLQRSIGNQYCRLNVEALL